MTPRGSDKWPSSPAGSIQAVTDLLHVHRYGPTRPPQILAVHGLTGHGRRWQTLATRHLPEFAIVAPDLIGHGRSSWAAPWSIDANADALAGPARRRCGRPGCGCRAFVRRRCGAESGCRAPGSGRRAGAARSRRRAGRRMDARHRRRHVRLAGLHRPRGGPVGKGERLMGGGGAGGIGPRARRAPDRRARRAGGLADQHSGDAVVLERAGATNSVAAE